MTPQLIGGTGGQMLGVQIQSNFKAIGDWPQGAALSVLMLLGFLALLHARLPRLALMRGSIASGGALMRIFGNESRHGR